MLIQDPEWKQEVSSREDFPVLEPQRLLERRSDQEGGPQEAPGGPQISGVVRRCPRLIDPWASSWLWWAYRGTTSARRLKMLGIGLLPGVRAGDGLVYLTHQAEGLERQKGSILKPR
jgi:hypothetical protein